MPSLRSDKAAIAKANSIKAKHSKTPRKKVEPLVPPKTREERYYDQERLERLGIGMKCWCGLPHGHTWEGMEEGAPHPTKRHQIVGVSPKLTPLQHVALKALRERVRVTQDLHTNTVNGLVSRGLATQFGSYTAITEKGREYLRVGRQPL